MIRREIDAVLANRVANDPSVRPWFGYHEGETDLSSILDHSDSYAIISNGEDAVAILEWSAPDVWQCHTMFLPSCRGRRGIETGKAMIQWGFENLGAKMIWGQTPLSNPQACMFNRLCGGKPAGRGIEASGQEVQYFQVEK